MSYNDEILKELTYATFSPSLERVNQILNKLDPMWSVSDLKFGETQSKPYSCSISIWVKHSDLWVFFAVSRSGCVVTKYINGSKE